ncbi:MAG: hypothetical protein GY725_19100 [bacterium]|nr:hypothetical protein [bacterium]
MEPVLSAERIDQLSGEYAHLKASIDEWIARFRLRFAQQDAIVHSLCFGAVYSVPGERYLIAQQMLVKESLFHFVVDDAIDDFKGTLADVHEFTERLHRFILEGRVDEHPVASELVGPLDAARRAIESVRGELRGLVRSERILDYWEGLVSETVAMMYREALLRAGEIRIGSQEYLEIGELSICAKPTLLAMSIALDEPAVCDELERYMHCIQVSGRIMRLANDIRSHLRKPADVVNMVAVLDQERRVQRGNPKSPSIQQVRASIRSSQGELAALLEQLESASQTAKSMIWNLSSINVRLYEHQDYRDSQPLGFAAAWAALQAPSTGQGCDRTP